MISGSRSLSALLGGSLLLAVALGGTSASAQETSLTVPPPEQSIAPSEDLKPRPKVHLGKLEHTDPTGRFWMQDTWDLNVDIFFGPVLERFDRMPPWTFGGRVRGGLMLIREPMFISVGLTAMVDTWRPPAFGVESELMHLQTGLWMHAGAFMDIEASGGATFAMGWSIYGLETQLRVDPSGEGVWTVLAKLRVPLRFFFMN